MSLKWRSGWEVLNFHVELQRGNAAYQLAPRGQPITVQRQRRQRRPQFVEVGTGVKHGAGDHVATEPGKRVEKS